MLFGCFSLLTLCHLDVFTVNVMLIGRFSLSTLRYLDVYHCERYVNWTLCYLDVFHC